MDSSGCLVQSVDRLSVFTEDLVNESISGLFLLVDKAMLPEPTRPDKLFLSFRRSLLSSECQWALIQGIVPG
jgi:hypothetical protein